jgi:hypothetical protein
MKNDVGRSGTGLAHALLDVTVQVGTDPESTEPLREVHPSQPAVITGATELAVVHDLGIALGEEGIDRIVDEGHLAVAHPSILPDAPARFRIGRGDESVAHGGERSLRWQTVDRTWWA